MIVERTRRPCLDVRIPVPPAAFSKSSSTPISPKSPGPVLDVWGDGNSRALQRQESREYPPNFPPNFQRERRPSIASLTSAGSSSTVGLSPGLPGMNRVRRPSLASLGSGISPRTPILHMGATRDRRPSLASANSRTMDAKAAAAAAASATKQSVIKSQTKISDNSDVYSISMIVGAIFVAACCGIAGFTLHLSVFFFGCLGGVNGCKESVVLDALEPLGVNKSVYFILSSGCSGFLCSCILYSPFKHRVARNCLGGGAAGTKIAISAGKVLSGWIVVFRILLAGLYLGGGNTLGTEGPVIHMGTALATYLTSLLGFSQRRKILSMFGVIGASAGISAGFSVLITGFIFTTEEITRTLSRRLALILTLASGVAFLVKDNLEHGLEHWLHVEHVSLVPKREVLEQLTRNEALVILALCIPIGILNGLAGWCLTRLAWKIRAFLNPGAGQQSRFHKILLPQRSHLATIGIITGCFGAVAYEATGVNGVWGTTFGAIPEAIALGITWPEALLLFLMKFLSFALATAGGGPGGMLVPSLVAGGFLGLMVGLLVGGGDAFSSACAVVGMGSLFASVMHLPVSGVIIIFELTKSTDVILPVVVANFISSNVAARLPHGGHSFAHLMLEHDAMWEKVGKHQDFIETDAQETAADEQVGFGKLPTHLKHICREFFRAEKDRLKEAFESWRTACDQWSGGPCSESGSGSEKDTVGICEQMMCKMGNKVLLHMAWSSWIISHKLKDQVLIPENIQQITHDSLASIESCHWDIQEEQEEDEEEEEAGSDVSSCVTEEQKSSSKGSTTLEPHPFAVPSSDGINSQIAVMNIQKELELVLGDRKQVDEVLGFLRRRRSFVAGDPAEDDVALEVELQDFLGKKVDCTKIIPFCHQYMDLENVESDGTKVDDIDNEALVRSSDERRSFESSEALGDDSV